MAEIRKIAFIPGTRKQPPSKPIDAENNTNMWYITEDEYLRLSKLFGRDFQETRLGGTRVHGLPRPCKDCGKYTEFIDWVWTALQRGVHSPEFMFNALRNGRQGDEVMHDVYCSECGAVVAYSRDKAEGGAPNISLATPIKRSDYPIKFKKGEKRENLDQPTWGKWWLDDTGSAAAFLAERKKKQAEAQEQAKQEHAQVERAESDVKPQT